MDSLIVSSSVFWVIAAPPIKNPLKHKIQQTKNQTYWKHSLKLKKFAAFAPALWSHRRREGCVYETHN
jgi:hypothetical protein